MSDPQTAIGLGTSLLVATGLAIDATAVSVGISASLPTVTHRHVFRLSWHFGLFQFLMPIAGWLLGAQVVQHVDGYDHWIAFALLAFVGGRMIHEAVVAAPAPRTASDAPPADALAHRQLNARKDPTRGWTLVMLSLGTSLDALAVGMYLALARTSPWSVAPVIGLVTAGLVLLGIKAGRLAGVLFGRAAAAAGGLILVLIGVRFLVQGLVEGA